MRIVDAVVDAVRERQRIDPEFMARLRRRVEEDRDILDVLADEEET